MEPGSLGFGDSDAQGPVTRAGPSPHSIPLPRAGQGRAWMAWGGLRFRKPLVVISVCCTGVTVPVLLGQKPDNYPVPH